MAPITTMMMSNFRVSSMRFQKAVQRSNSPALSERLQSAAGWSINAVGIRRIEDKERRVTPDDLVALALALGVSPITLLMPDVSERKSLVAVTGVQGRQPAYRVWDWLRAEEPLAGGRGQTWLQFCDASWPEWEGHRLVEKLEEKKRAQGAHLKARRASKKAAADGDD
jgi:hypothetical protein